MGDPNTGFKDTHDEMPCILTRHVFHFAIAFPIAVGDVYKELFL